jgi:hypothetical protein
LVFIGVAFTDIVVTFFRAGFQQGASAMFAMGKIGVTSNVGSNKNRSGN